MWPWNIEMLLLSPLRYIFLEQEMAWSSSSNGTSNLWTQWHNIVIYGVLTQEPWKCQARGACCFLGVSMAVIKRYDQKQLQEGSVYFTLQSLVPLPKEVGPELKEETDVEVTEEWRPLFMASLVCLHIAPRTAVLYEEVAVPTVNGHTLHQSSVLNMFVPTAQSSRGIFSIKVPLFQNDFSLYQSN